jgi:hypothetical protein
VRLRARVPKLQPENVGGGHYLSSWLKDDNPRLCKRFTPGGRYTTNSVSKGKNKNFRHFCDISCPQILSVEDGDAIDLKIKISLRKDDPAAGSVSLTVGSLQLLLHHRVLRLLRLYLSPLDLAGSWARVLALATWILGPGIKILSSRERHVSLRVKMDGPTLLVPEMKENHNLLSLYLGKVSLENMMTHEGMVENLLLEMVEGQVTRAVMDSNQSILEYAIIAGELACKVDMKRNRGKGTKDAVISLDNINVNLTPKDIQLALHILQNNLLKLKEDTEELFPTCIFNFSEEQEPLIIEDSRWTAHLMVDQVKH